MTKSKMKLALGAVVLLLPTLAAAQNNYGQIYGRPVYLQYYEQAQGDYYNRWRGRYGSYPEFRGIEQHIRSEIQEGLREDLIEPDDARDLMGRLRTIQAQEAQEFRVHGWNLPEDDRYRLRSQLEELDQLVDQIRAEPEDS